MRIQDGKTVIKFAIAFLIVSAIAGYSYFQARNLIKGPQVSIEFPANGSTMANPLVAVQGSAKNISYISLNGRQIYVDKDGDFKEELLLAPGYNIWKVEAKDKFGRSVSKKIELVLNKSL